MNKVHCNKNSTTRKVKYEKGVMQDKGGYKNVKVAIKGAAQSRCRHGLEGSYAT